MVVASKGPFEKKRIEKNLNEICEPAHRLFPEGTPALCIFQLRTIPVLKGTSGH